MIIKINEGMDLSVHMRIIAGLAGTLQQSLNEEPGLEDYTYTAMLLRIYIDSLIAVFEELGVNIS